MDRGTRRFFDGLSSADQKALLTDMYASGDFAEEAITAAADAMQS